MNSNGNWVLQVDPAVYRFLKRIPRKDVEHILFVIEKQLPANPFFGDIQQMGGERNVWRRRIGAYRIKFEIFKALRIIHIFSVERRTSKTYWAGGKGKKRKKGLAAIVTMGVIMGVQLP